MSGHWQKVVSGACKPKHAPPKPKYIDALISCTYQSDGSFQDVSRALRSKLRDPNSSIVFKALLVIHTLIRAGNSEEVMTYWSGVDGRDGRSLGLNVVSTTNDTPQNLARYANYLLARFKCFAALKHDPIRTRSEAPASLRNSSRNGANRLRTLTVEKGLLREVGTLQKLMDALVDCKFYLEDTDDDLVMSALRLLVKDLLVLFQAVNEGVINVLEHYFEMSHVDATTALKTYKIFCKQCEKVVAYLGVAKKLQNIINVNIPNLRHAPVSLAGSLEEYLNDPNFETNRAEYKESKRIADGKPPDKTATPKPTATKQTASTPNPPPPPIASEAQKTFTDFFESIESQQSSMFNADQMSPNGTYSLQQPPAHPFQQPSTAFPIQSQPTGFASQQVNFMDPQPTGFVNPQPTGYGRASIGHALFGTLNGPNAPQFIQTQPTGFPPSGQMNALQPQMTGVNPFRQSMVAPNNLSFGAMAPQPTGYNPFMQSQQSTNASTTHSMLDTWQSSHMQNGMPDRNNGAMSAPPVQLNQQPNAFDSSTPFGSSTNQPVQTALKPQMTGSRNPFAPAPNSMPAVPKLPDNLSLNALAASAFSQSMVQQRAREQAAALQQQQQNAKQSQATPNNASTPDPSVLQEQQRSAEQKAQFTNFFSSQLSKLEGGGRKIDQQGTGGLFTSVASEFAVTKPKVPEESSLISSQPELLINQPTGFPNPQGFQSISSQPTGFSNSQGFQSISSQPTGFSNSQGFQSIRSQPTGFGGSTIKPFQPSSSLSTSSNFNTQAPIVSQPTGFGGSTIKPFQPSSSFGTELAQSLNGPNPFRASVVGTSTPGGGGGTGTQGFAGLTGAHQFGTEQQESLI